MFETLESVIQGVVTAELHQIYTAMPCRVINVVGRIVDVEPLLNALYRSGDVRARPPILGVPLQEMGTGTSLISLPVNKGDTVLCIFSMRGIDAFMASDGSPVTPTDYRILDKRDAIAIPGLFPSQLHPTTKITAFDPTALSITHNIGLPTEVSIKLTEAGEIQANAPVAITLTAPILNLNGVVNINGVPYLAHVHSGITPGTGVGGPVVV